MITKLSDVEKKIAEIKHASPAKIEKITNKIAEKIVKIASSPAAAKKVA